ncbi:MAG: 2-phospho-L-lactate guanylyltransferase [Nitrososphaerota archaeon]|nr:2-phospho-L-lactate guanylyltransferase [Aigarchaeota archaeon]MDW8076968.1 2-phospho-L-lactate guanylyltransferase [Nitrososphaerota archaeon]
MLEFAIIPVKKLADGKSRLKGLLTLEQRRHLILKMLGGVIDTCLEAGLSKVYVIGSDPEVEVLAKHKGLSFIHDTWCGLNESLEGAIGMIYPKHVGSFVIFPCDLPLLSPEDVKTIGKLLEYNDVVISPSFGLKGTNALAMKEAYTIKMQFGSLSFPKHMSSARVCGKRVATYASLGTCLDIDLPKDLKMLSKLSKSARRGIERLRALNYFTFMRFLSSSENV